MFFILTGCSPNRAVGRSEAPVGVEPNLNSDATAYGDCGYVNCPKCGAANVLQDGHFDCLALASLDNDLQRVVGAWDGLPAHMDLSAGESQEYVEDCPVCCRPNIIHVEIEEGGEVRVWAEAE